MPQHGADRAVGGRQDPPPQHGDRQRRADPRQHVQGAEKPLPGSSRASIVAASSPSTVCTGTTIATNDGVTTSDLPNVESVSTERQLSSPTYCDRPQQVPAVQAQPDHDQHRQQQEDHDAEQAGRQQRIAQRGRSTRRWLAPAMEVIKAASMP